MTEQPSQSAALPDTEAPSSAAIEIRVEDLYKAFETKKVLCGVSLEVHRGEMVAIVGGSGSGKTVLLRHLIGHFVAEQGRVLVADHESPGSPLTDLATLDEPGLDRLRRHWAVVFQGNALFPGTVYENIALALREVKGLDEETIHRRVLDVVAAVGLDVRKDLALDRENLSGGMAKRVGIARALALEPLLIFYDEPTSGLDPLLSGQIHDLIQAAHERKAEAGMQRTSILVTHDKDLLRRLEPRTVMLHEGRVFFDGAYAQFEQSDSPIIRPYFELMPVLHGRAWLQR